MIHFQTFVRPGEQHEQSSTHKKVSKINIAQTPRVWLATKTTEQLIKSLVTNYEPTLSMGRPLLESQCRRSWIAENILDGINWRCYRSKCRNDRLMWSTAFVTPSLSSPPQWYAITPSPTEFFCTIVVEIANPSKVSTFKSRELLPKSIDTLFISKQSKIWRVKDKFGLVCISNINFNS